jgi:glycosyltransferase 2 family protein
MRKKSLQIAIKSLITLGFLAWIIFSVDWMKVLYYFRQLDIWWMFAFLILYSLGIVISSYKWKILSNFIKIKADYTFFFKTYLTGAFINNFFPSIIGGDAYRSFKLGKSNNSRYLEATSTVLADRISGLLGVMLLIFFFSLHDLDFLLKSRVLLFFDAAILLFFALLFSMVILARFSIGKKIFDIFPQKVASLSRSLGTYTSGRIFFLSLTWGAIFNFIGVGLATWMLFLDLHIPISFSGFLVAVSVTSIISSIPINIGNIGIKEWSFITFFGLYGVDGEAALSIAIFARFLQMIVSFFAIPFYLKEKAGLKTAGETFQDFT